MNVSLIVDLCKKKNITIAVLERELGFGNGTIRRWMKNEPSSDKILKVADYFNISTDYLHGKYLDGTKAAHEGQPLSESDKKILDAFKGLTDEQKDKVIDKLVEIVPILARE